MNSFSKYVIGFTGVIIVLIYGQSILVPFIFALLLWFTIRVLVLFQKNIPVLWKIVPENLKKNYFLLILVFSILYFFSQIILSSFNSIIDSHHDYDENLSNLITFK